MLDGVFDVEPASGAQVRFREAVGFSAQEVAAVQAQVRRRVLRGFVHRGWLTDEDPGGRCNAGCMARASRSPPRSALRRGSISGNHPIIGR